MLMSSISEIISCFQAILEQGEALSYHVLNELKHLPLWMSKNELLIEERSLFTEAILNFYKGGETSPQHTKSYQGALGCTEITFNLAVAFNRTKDKFKNAVKAYLDEIKYKETDVIRQILKNAGYAGLKLKQVYRHLVLLDYHPRRISFSKIKHNANCFISKEEALAKLQKTGRGIHIQVQEDKLHKSLEQGLVIHRETPSTWIANVSTFKNENNLSISKKIITSLPLLYLHEEGKPHPEVTYGNKQQKERKQRSDKKIENEVFLRSIHAYRYKDED